MAEVLRRATSYPRQQLTAGYGYWPSLADRPVSCAPRRRCGILLRGQEEAVHVKETVCRRRRWESVTKNRKQANVCPSSQIEVESARGESTRRRVVVLEDHSYFEW